ncbi:unnamed protein product [Prunus armeniaca]|uniref:Reverse transcriptase domain-containing protein n=1 Tax=Prunus armeniaca TaxID=36596 RepID=A0A6J5VNM3_PRUAR|nr:unnamed protein product [Prunus armeniaca]
MIFRAAGRVRCLVGQTSIATFLGDSESMTKTLAQEKQGFIAQLVALDNPIPPTTSSTDLGLLLAKFTELFSAPTGLPPFRPTDHRIPLNPGTPPVNVRPYKYPHFQKSEIETIVREILAVGLVQPSCSAYSSPVLLVKKKDGFWSLCVDYRCHALIQK